jgi:uncharacterized protein VirK/YbjX
LSSLRRSLRFGAELLEPDHWPAMQALARQLFSPAMAPLLLQSPRLLVKAFGRHRQSDWSTAERLAGLARHLTLLRCTPLMALLAPLAGGGLPLFAMPGQEAVLQFSRNSRNYLDTDQEGELELRWLADGEVVWLCGFFLDQPPGSEQRQLVLTRNQGTAATKARRQLWSQSLHNLDFFRLALWSLQGVARACTLHQLVVLPAQWQCTLAAVQVSSPQRFSAGARQYHEVFHQVDHRLAAQDGDRSRPLSLPLPIPLLNAADQPVKWRGRRERGHQLLRAIEQASFEAVR